MSTTPYAVSTSIGSVSYDGYVNAPITGPLSTSQTPGQIPYHSHGSLPGVNPTPPQFFPYQTPPPASLNTNARMQYLRATGYSTNALARQWILGKVAPPTGYFVASSGRIVPTSTHTNYIPPIPASMYADIVKSRAVGQTAFKVGLPDDALTSTKSYYPSGTRTTIRRVRSGGCTAPKKKGAVENTSLRNGMVCAWGSIVRSTY